MPFYVHASILGPETEKCFFALEYPSSVDLLLTFSFYIHLFFNFSLANHLVYKYIYIYIYLYIYIFITTFEWHETTQVVSSANAYRYLYIYHILNVYTYNYKMHHTCMYSIM